MSDLLPCPFCGGIARQHFLTVICDDCGASTKQFAGVTGDFNEEDVLVKKAWNRRAAAAPPPDPEKELGESKKNQNQKTRPAALVAADGAWVGDLNDDCWLERYGMAAHVEKMDTNHWWFNVTRKWPDGRPGYDDIFNMADQQTHVPLTTGKMARRAAECVMEAIAAIRATKP